MRDGKRLFTAVYVPKDSAGGPYPFLMDRTPYSVGPYGEDQYPARIGPSDEFEKSGYIFVYQDVRGRWMSEGDFLEMRPHIDVKKSPQDVDDASDTYDTIEFLLKHVANNNGKVGHLGNFVSRVLYVGIDHRFAPGVGCCQSAGADDGSFSWAMMATMAEHSCWRPTSVSMHSSIRRKIRPGRAPSIPFDFGTPDRYRFYLDAGNVAISTQNI